MNHKIEYFQFRNSPKHFSTREWSTRKREVDSLEKELNKKTEEVESFKVPDGYNREEIIDSVHKSIVKFKPIFTEELKYAPWTRFDRVNATPEGFQRFLKKWENRLSAFLRFDEIYHFGNHRSEIFLELRRYSDSNEASDGTLNTIYNRLQKECNLNSLNGVYDFVLLIERKVELEENLEIARDGLGKCQRVGSYDVFSLNDRIMEMAKDGWKVKQIEAIQSGQHEYEIVRESYKDVGGFGYGYSYTDGVMILWEKG